MLDSGAQGRVVLQIGAVGQQHQYIDVGVGKQFAPAKATYGDQTELVRQFGQMPQVAQQSISQGGQLAQLRLNAARTAAPSHDGLEQGGAPGLVLLTQLRNAGIVHGCKSKRSMAVCHSGKPMIPISMCCASLHLGQPESMQRKRRHAVRSAAWVSAELTAQHLVVLTKSGRAGEPSDRVSTS